MLAQRLCFVDVETTGTRPADERVTEVAVVSVDADGEALRVSEWSSLVNPGVPIPAEIQWLTGISNDMVRAAPRFAEIAQDLAARLEGAVFVAHNVRFDYSFLKAEFARAGIHWRAATLCTVRLSRHLYPDRAPHTLDAIVLRFGLEGEQRHRALGDARVLWRLIQVLEQRHGAAELQRAFDQLLARPSLPPALPAGELEQVPHCAGVYLFFGANAHPLYIGKSVDLAARIAQHFANDHASGADLRLSQEIRRLEWEETAGEIGAWLREVELIKTRLPAHNIALRRRRNLVFVAIGDGGRLQFTRAADLAADEVPGRYGPFASRASVRRMFEHLAAEEGLCLKTIGLEPRKRKAAADSPCFNFQLGRCRGCCVGAEPASEHAARLREALVPRQVLRWPFDGALIVIERDRAGQREDFHVFDRWCWLGSARNLAAAEAMAEQAPRQFDADIYRIVREALRRVEAGRLVLHESLADPVA
jgi:DNA polymerase III subunit epsilon